ncbi:hypothetical protein J6590_058067 [Homalodisca vitripennis]|nr:hypothetical protein J6590_058067 [Homalodisca vitripennis]
MDDVEVSTLANKFTSVPVESPFVWGMSALLVKESSNILERLLEKQDVVEEHYEQFKWSHFVIQLLLSYELCNSGNQSEAVKKIESCEAELTRLDRIGCNERFYLRMRRPLWHLTLASRALLFATISNFEVDLDYLDQEMGQKYNLTLFSDEERASLYGTKTICYLEYGYNGNMEALKWARKALETDPSEAEWHFLTGKCMGRVRRCTRKFSGVPREEVEMIEKAVSLNPNPKYIMYVAQVYQQSASAAFIHHRGDENFYRSSLYQAINNMNKKAVELYQQALVFRPNCSYTYIRCLNGMLKLPRKYLNLAQLRKMVDKAMLRSPRRSAKQHALRLGISNTSVRRILHQELNFHSYKIQIEQSLKPTGHQKRVQFCEEMARRLEENVDQVNNLWMRRISTSLVLLINKTSDTGLRKTLAHFMKRLFMMKK